MADSSAAVAVIGIGIMGSAIARNLIAAGRPVVGYDTNPARLGLLREFGGTAVRSAAEAGAMADLVLTSLPHAASLDETISALLGVSRPGTVVAELSTLPLEVKGQNRARLAAAGVVMLDCPLSGTGAQAMSGDLAVYASGERSAYDRTAATFAQFARVSHYLGAFGNGSKMKFVANLLVAIHNVASSEAMVLGLKAGLDPDMIVKVIGSGAGTSRIFELRAPMMARDSYEPPSMKIDVWQKDMAIIAAFAESLGVAAPLFKASAPIYDMAVEQGLGSLDTAAVCRVLERLAALQRH